MLMLMLRSNIYSSNATHCVTRKTKTVKAQLSHIMCSYSPWCSNLLYYPQSLRALKYSVVTLRISMRYYTITYLLPASLSCLIWANSVAFCCFIFLTALHYNNLLLLSEVGGMRSVHFVLNRSQMTHQTPLCMWMHAESEEEKNKKN